MLCNSVKCFCSNYPQHSLQHSQLKLKVSNRYYCADRNRVERQNVTFIIECRRLRDTRYSLEFSELFYFCSACKLKSLERRGFVCEKRLEMGKKMEEGRMEEERHNKGKRGSFPSRQGPLKSNEVSIFNYFA
jgi:hypothetical protein